MGLGSAGTRPHVQLYRLCTAEVQGIPSYRHSGKGTPCGCAVLQLHATTCAGMGRESIPDEGNREQGDGQEPLNLPGPGTNGPGLNASRSVFCLLLLLLLSSNHGAFLGLLSSCDECPLVACIDSPSEALAWFLINPPSGCSVLSGHSAPYLLQ